MDEKIFVHIDCKAILNHIDGDLEMLDDLSKDLFAIAPEMFANIEKAIADLNYSQLTLVAHSFKGAVSNFFAFRVVDCAYKLEQMGKQQTMDKADQVFMEMKTLFFNFQAELKQFIAQQSGASI
jgi:HPt (histidine-containing phosphotransfer) domain-containing protein